LKSNIYKYFTILSFSGLALSTNVKASPYTFTDLGTLGGIHSSAMDLNDAGKVVGYSYKPFSGNSAIYSAFLWDGSVMFDLGTLGGTQSIATSINKFGQIAGWANVNGDTTNHAVVWNGSDITDLNPLGSNHSAAYGINDLGKVVGYQSSFLNTATIWDMGVATELGIGIAQGINNSGVVVGYQYDGYAQAVTWNGTDTTILSNNSFANAINDTNQVVGMQMAISNEIYVDGVVGNPATLWDGGVATYLGYLGGTQSSGLDINNLGEIVGYSFGTGNSKQYAFLWRDGVITDLNSLLDLSTIDAGWSLSIARAINNNGWIVGDAYNSRTNETHAFLLSVTPVPEPESYAMMLMGIGMLGFMARRRKVAG
jgi:probable HAF family extracellular repeat protein